MPTVTTSLPHLASLIDHSLLHPTLPTTALTSGLALALRHCVAAACVPPYAVPLAAAALAGSPVRVCAVVGFPHGTSTTTTKIFEAVEAMDSGAHEIDVVVNVGKVLSGEWEYVRAELEGVNEAVVGRGGVVKVIFENDFLGEEEVAELARVCAGVGVAWVKTSTGFGFVKMGEGYGYRGARGKDIKVMRENCGAARIKAAGGLRTLDEVLWAVKLGAERVGATATEGILEEARRRGVGEEMRDCEFVVPEREREEGL